MTFECLRLHTLHAKPRENEFEYLSRQCLSEDIRQLILCPYEIQLNYSILYLFSNEMMSDVDVFRPRVLDIVVAESYGTFVVIIQRSLRMEMEFEMLLRLFVTMGFRLRFEVVVDVVILIGCSGLTESVSHSSFLFGPSHDSVVTSLTHTPMDTSEKLMSNNSQAVSQLEYSRVIDCLMYAMTCTRPDIAFVVGKLSRYTSNPGTQHWQAIQRLLKYLKKTIDYRLTYTCYPSMLEGYTDARWISNSEDNSSTSGWVFLLGGGEISWASKKQTCITGSIIESEFMALVAASKEVKWLKNLVLEILLWSKPIAPISIRCDSVATLAKAYSQMYNGKFRHLGVRHSMIRELIKNGVVSIEFVRSQRNLTDHFMKGLARELVEGMGLKSNQVAEC
ncbi:hypothetical protein Tco_1136116 [Tanacetum coccineum]